ncbi:MAG: hypothetical protein DMF59_01815 [Acidobacteria bacterium]|nr:MAG: hypothetical protein DMF59_01815 [Acidobacteriota bacterium]
MKRAVVGIAALFFVPRLILLFVRQPFFDELFTHWISGQSFAGILRALHYDSGPPLYYFIIHLLGDPPVLVIRAVSLLCSTIALVALLMSRRFTAAALLAVFPPAVLLAVDARAYALCAMFVALGVLALDRDRPYLAAFAFVAAAYSHYYGALFIVLLWRNWKPVAIAIVLFLPGAWLALHQPRESVAWMGGFPRYPDVLFARPPIWLLVVAVALLVVAAYRLNRYAAMTLIPLALALALGIYFPLRFESVIAVPFALWIAASAHKKLIPLLIAVGVAICAIGIVDHAQRPLDDYRDAAMHLRGIEGPVVASGYLYLEAIMVRPVVAFPPEQALHPGWRAIPLPGSKPPDGTFIWIGESRAPELSIIRRSRKITPIYVNQNAAIVKVN